MSISFSEIIDNGLIDSNVMGDVVKKCKCGGDIVFSDSLTQMRCSNDNCSETIASRAINMVKRLGINDIDSDDIRRIVVDNKIKSPYQLLIISQLCKSDDELKVKQGTIDKLSGLLGSSIKLPNMVFIGDFRYVSTVADYIFDGYESVEEAYCDIEAGQIAILSDIVGVCSSDALILPMLLYERLTKIKEELIFASKLFKIEADNESIHIGVASSVGRYINKNILKDRLREEYKRGFVINSKISERTDILICNGDLESVKYRNAVLINKKYGYDKIKITDIENLHEAINKEVSRRLTGDDK